MYKKIMVMLLHFLLSLLRHGTKYMSRKSCCWVCQKAGVCGFNPDAITILSIPPDVHVDECRARINDLHGDPHKVTIL